MLDYWSPLETFKQSKRQMAIFTLNYDKSLYSNTTQSQRIFGHEIRSAMVVFASNKQIAFVRNNKHFSNYDLEAFLTKCTLTSNYQLWRKVTVIQRKLKNINKGVETQNDLLYELRQIISEQRTLTLFCPRIITSFDEGTFLLYMEDTPDYLCH